MITATQLRKSMEASQEEVDRVLALIEPELVKAAELGKREYACYQFVEWQALRSHEKPKTSSLITKVINVLHEYGYDAAVQAHGDSYVPRGYDEDSQDFHQNHVLVIRW